MTIPSIEGVISVMRDALRHTGISPAAVDYINAHGTGTLANDRTESLAIRTVFQNRLYNIPVSSIKSMIGHTMGAASALEAIACCLTVLNDQLPPTINYDTPDPECQIDCVPNVSRQHRVNYALNNSFAFGGNNASLVFGKAPTETAAWAPAKEHGTLSKKL
jgi:3-oxoacyl-[acyl-carrier-protein] synthase II